MNSGALDDRRRRKRRQIGKRRVAALRAPRRESFAGGAERAHAVDRDRRRRRAPELIVEDLERQRPAVAGARRGVEKIDDRKVALAGIAAVVPAQRQRVHDQGRRVGHLDERDSLGRQSRDRLDRIAAHADVKAVEHDAEIVAVGGAQNLPGGRPVFHVPAPGERLVADPHAMLAGEIGELREICGGSRRVVDRFRRDVGADAEKPAPEFVHEFELARRALEIAFPDRLRHRLEIAQRLKRDDFEPEIGRHAPHVSGLSVEEGQVVLEQFDRAEARLGRGGELALQRAAHADGGDRPSQHGNLLHS